MNERRPTYLIIECSEILLNDSIGVDFVSTRKDFLLPVDLDGAKTTSRYRWVGHR